MKILVVLVLSSFLPSLAFAWEAKILKSGEFASFNNQVVVCGSPAASQLKKIKFTVNSEMQSLSADAAKIAAKPQMESLGNEKCAMADGAVALKSIASKIECGSVGSVGSALRVL